MGKIRSQNLRRCRTRSSAQSERHIASAAAKIKHASRGTFENCIKLAGSAPPPQTVDVTRENVIQKIVARRNRSEHLADSLRRRLAVLGTGGRCPNPSLLHFWIHIRLCLWRARRPRPAVREGPG